MRRTLAHAGNRYRACGCRYGRWRAASTSASDERQEEVKRKRGQAIYIAATREHTGKTSVSMALLSGLIRRFGADRVAYIKPVGQKFVEVDDGDRGRIKVDKDVRVAKEHFGLRCRYGDMSPLVLERGYTQKFLEGKIDPKIQEATVREAYERLVSDFDFVVVEGTGHTGVGSIVKSNNAAVAAMLGVRVVLVANGGVGSAFDDLELNRQMCLAYGANMVGVILNKVLPDKVPMVRSYLSKALKPWNAPLVGVVPFADSLDTPSILDVEHLFNTQLISGHSHRLQRISRFELVVEGCPKFMERLNANKQGFVRTCFVTHASRNDIILGLLSHAAQRSPHDAPFEGALLLTGTPPVNVPHEFMLSYVRHSGLPTLCSGLSTSKTTAAIENFTAKMHAGDSERTTRVVQHYEPYINFPLLLRLAPSDTDPDAADLPTRLEPCKPGDAARAAAEAQAAAAAAAAAAAEASAKAAAAVAEAAAAAAAAAEAEVEEPQRRLGT